MIERINVPWFLKRGIGPNHYGFNLPAFKLLGGDTETVDGKPLTIQIHDGQDTDLLWVDRENVWEAFLRAVVPKLQSRVNVIYFHNLAYDLVVLLYPFYKEFAAHPNRLTLRGRYGRKAWRLEVWYGKRWWAKLYVGDRRLWLLDSWAFVFCSLDRISEKIGLSLRKLDKPPYLGQRGPTEHERPAFEEYAKRDAVLTYGLGQWIIGQHREFDVKLCVSLPQFSGRVLRHHFFEDDERIELPDPATCRASVLSYHGGKNGCYVKSGWYRRVYEADLTSAYAWAMTAIPQMVKGHYQRVRALARPDQPGLYRVSGKVTSRCPYPIFFSHDFTATPAGARFTNTWVTSYELFEALKHREVILTALTGVVWVPDPAHDHNPLKAYNESFFAKKAACAKGDPRREIYKLLNNALYGKFIQHMKVDSEVEVHLRGDGSVQQIVEGTYTAGGLFQPFLGSLITGLVRARMHDLEVRYQALHTATDSIKTRIKPTETAGLGGLQVVCYGDCLILRNKLYVHFDEHGHMAKWATHGFQSTPAELLSMVREHRSTYRVRHITQLREALQRGLEPLTVQDQQRRLSLDRWPDGTVRLRGDCEARPTVLTRHS